jgi:hypothetical protein
MRASYSAMLLVAQKCRRMVYSMRSPIGETRMTPALALVAKSDPLKHNVQYSWRVEGGGVYTLVHSMMKSMRTCDLIVILRT